MQKKIRLLSLACFCIFLSGCSPKNEDSAKDTGKKGSKPTLISVSEIKKQPLEITETTVGTLEGLIDPTIAAEVSAKVIKVFVRPGQEVKQGELIASLDPSDYGMQRNEAQAEVARIEALLQNQTKTVLRNQALVDKKFISQNALDSVLAEQNSLKEQLKGAKARVGSINHTSSKTSVYSPVSGIIQVKMVDTGDYVKIGDPIVEIISSQRLIAHLPFPEQIAAKLKPGLKVRLSTPTTTQSVTSVINELKPMIATGSRSVDVIANVNNQAGWRPGASVTGTVVIGELPTAMMVPEQCVVLRPAGEVVYVVRGNRAYQSVVKTGLRQNGFIEIISGVNEKDTVVVDGAGFLTNDTSVKIATGDKQK